MNEKGKVTIYDLAAKLNTTASTVSRALQNSPRISQKMRKAVHELAEKLHYIPDPIAHHLRTGKGNVLGIVVPRIDRNYFASIISSFQKTAMQKNYNIIIAASNESAEDELAAVKALLSKKVDGIAISVAAEESGNDYEELCKVHNTPILFFDRVPATCSVDTVTNDNYKIGYDAVLQLKKIGCKKIGHFAGPRHMKMYSERMAGFKQALIDCSMEFNEDFVYNNCITLEKGVEAAENILDNSKRPDAIFSAGDFSAISALDTFRRKGVNSPKDIAMIGVANESLNSYLSTPLASFDLNKEKIGELAANILLERISDKSSKKETQNVIVDHTLVLRESAL